MKGGGTRGLGSAMKETSWGADLKSQREGAPMGNGDKNIPEEGKVSWALQPLSRFKS